MRYLKSTGLLMIAFTISLFIFSDCSKLNEDITSPVISDENQSLQKILEKQVLYEGTIYMDNPEYTIDWIKYRVGCENYKLRVRICDYLADDPNHGGQGSEYKLEVRNIEEPFGGRLIGIREKMFFGCGVIGWDDLPFDPSTRHYFTPRPNDIYNKFKMTITTPNISAICYLQVMIERNLPPPPPPPREE
jgi:hypothetical protein